MRYLFIRNNVMWWWVKGHYRVVSYKSHAQFIEMLFVWNCEKEGWIYYDSIKKVYIRELNELDCELLISWWGNGELMKDVGSLLIWRQKNTQLELWKRCRKMSLYNLYKTNQ